MTRYKLKHGGSCRKKAFLGADGAVMAAATIAAAGMTTAATISSAKQQAKAVEASAKTQADALQQQNANANALQKENIAFTQQQNQETRDQQREIQMALQMLAGQQNSNDRMEINKIQVKYGGRRKLKKGGVNSSQPSYGGAQQAGFKVTDGGVAMPIQIDNNGYGLYELQGDTHEQHHRDSNGKDKTGIGLRLKNGGIVEGEGGELFYNLPNDKLFISKHDVGGFNPKEAVEDGMNPITAFNIQQAKKQMLGLNDDGSRKKANLGMLNVMDPSVNLTQSPINGTAGVAGGVAFGLNNSAQTSTPVEERKKFGGRHKASLGSWWKGLSQDMKDNYAGAGWNSLGNFAGAAITGIGNMYAGRKLANAYSKAGSILSDAYGNLQTIDMSLVDRNDYMPENAMAVVRSANTNINPQLQRIQRNADTERRAVNNNTLSSAARYRQLIGINDRALQRSLEQFAYKNNADEQIKQANAQAITQTLNENANRFAQAMQAYGRDRISLAQYNNDIVNQRILGQAQANVDALTQSASTLGNAYTSAMQGYGNAIANAGQAFGSAYDANRTYNRNMNMVLYGTDMENRVNYAVTQAQNGDTALAKAIHKQLKSQSGNPVADKYLTLLESFI